MSLKVPNDDVDVRGPWPGCTTATARGTSHQDFHRTGLTVSGNNLKRVLRNYHDGGGSLYNAHRQDLHTIYDGQDSLAGIVARSTANMYNGKEDNGPCIRRRTWLRSALELRQASR